MLTPHALDSRVQNMETREQAAAAGKVHYLGTPCRHGHGGERYVLSNACVSCDKQNAARQAAKRKARMKELRAAAREG